MADPMTEFGVKRLAYAYTAARAARHYERDYWHDYAAALHGRLPGPARTSPVSGPR